MAMDDDSGLDVEPGEQSVKVAVLVGPHQEYETKTFEGTVLFHGRGRHDCLVLETDGGILYFCPAGWSVRDEDAGVMAIDESGEEGESIRKVYFWFEFDDIADLLDGPASEYLTEDVRIAAALAAGVDPPLKLLLDIGARAITDADGRNKEPVL